MIRDKPTDLLCGLQCEDIRRSISGGKRPLDSTRPGRGSKYAPSVSPGGRFCDLGGMLPSGGGYCNRRRCRGVPTPGQGVLGAATGGQIPGDGTVGDQDVPT